MNKVKFSNLRPKNNDKDHNMKWIPLVIIYYLLLKTLSGITDKNLSISKKSEKSMLHCDPWFYFVVLAN